MKTTFCNTITSDKLRLHGLLFEPDKESKKAIVYVHGLTGDFYGAIFLSEMIRQFPKAGYAFLSVNNRGQNFVYDFEVVNGNKEEYRRAGSIFECFEDCLKDIGAWTESLKDRGYDEIVLLGHSFGAAKTLYYQYTKRDKNVRGLIFASPTDNSGMTRGKNTTLLPQHAKKIVFLFYRIAKWYHNCRRVFMDRSNADMFPVSRNGDEGAFKEFESITVPILIIYSGNDENAIFSPEKDLEIMKSHCKCETGGSDGFMVGKTSHSYFKHEKETALGIVRWLKEVL